MGLIADSKLRNRQLQAPRPKPAGSIAAAIERNEATATLLEKHSGKWQYAQDEIPIHLILNNWLELPIDSASRLYSAGITVSVDAKSLPKLPQKQQYFVVAALKPATWGWSVCAPLRRAFNRSKAERTAEIQRSLAQGHALRDLSWDPYHQTKGELAACLNDPLRLHYDNGVNLGGGFLIGSQPKGIDKAIWRFGICPQACLEGFEIPLEPSRSYAGQSLVRVPRSPARSLKESALRYALAGRAGHDPVRLETVLKEAWNSLDPHKTEERSQI